MTTMTTVRDTRTAGYQCAPHRVNEQLCIGDNALPGACGPVAGSVRSRSWCSAASSSSRSSSSPRSRQARGARAA